MFEFIALAHKEREDREFHIKALKRTMIQVMGLNLKAQLEAKEGEQPDPDDFMPLAMICGNPHLLKGIFKGSINPEDEMIGSSGIPDEEYEAMSKRIMSDMEPITGDPFVGQSAKDLLAAQDIKKLGIKIIDDTPTPRSDRHTVDVTEE